ncbi:MAG: hypothetical protein OEW67_08095 [Cyclobacteriaceae bacterium]|nr:hypothetical protein [Cyclobacteriaceae bacterium]
MSNDILGRDWASPFRQIYWLLLSILASSLIFFLVSWGLGYSSSISWDVIAQGEALPFTLDSFEIGPFKLPLLVDTYLLTERFNGTALKLHTFPAYIFVALMSVLFVVLNSFITTLKRFWYIVAMGLVIVFLVSFQLEQLRLFGLYNKIGVIISFILYIPLSYFFHAIKPNILFKWRIVGFGVATVLFAVIIHFFSEVKSPFLYLATYGYAAPVLLTMLFILLVGAEILSGFVFLLTRSISVPKKNNNTFHFLMISGIYLANLFLVFLYDVNYLGWKLDFISPFILLIVSTGVGFFMYAYKEELYKNIYSYYPTGAILYASLATISFFTIGYHIFTANDPIVEVIKTFIYYSHLGYGLLFLVYVLANFLNPFGRGLQVYKVLYKPHNMPYFTYRFAGSIAVLALFLLTNYDTPMFATFSSYYNGIGDLHAINNEDKIAEAYYINGNIYSYDSHRSSYALASLALRNNDEKAAAHYYAKAIQKQSSEQAYINLSNAFIDKNQPFEAIFTLQDGLVDYPNSDRIKNNLGLLYYKVAEIDSAFIMMSDAQKAYATSSTAGVNMLNFVAKGNYSYNLDSLINLYADRDYFSSKGNIKVLYNLNNEYDETIDIQVDSTLNLLTAYHLYNSEINKVFGSDSIRTDHLLSLANRWENGYWNEMLVFGAAIGHYYNGNVIESFRLINNLANNNYQKAGYYYNVMGLLAMDQKAPRLAVDYFGKADYSAYEDGKRNIAIALSEAQLLDEAIPAWQEIILSGNPTTRYMAEQMLSFYNDTLANTDTKKYWNWKYEVAKNNFIKNELVREELTSSVYKNQLGLDLIDYHLNNGNYKEATEEFALIENVDETHLQRYYWLSMQIADINNDINQLRQNIDKISSGRSNTNQLAYYQMRVADLSGDTLTANNFITQFRNKNSFFEAGVVGLSNYYQKYNRPFEAYEVLVNAILVNKYSPRLLKAYILQCARMDFDSYAIYELERIRELIPGEDYQLLMEEYQELLVATRAEFEGY